MYKRSGIPNPIGFELGFCFIKLKILISLLIVSLTNTLLLSNNNSLYFIPLVGLHEEINIIVNIVKVFL